MQGKEGNTVSVEEWLALWLDTYKTRSLRPKTLESYRRVIHAYILPRLGALPLEAVTPEDCQAAVNAVLDQGYGRQAQIAFSVLTAALGRAVRSGRLDRSPMAALDAPSHAQQHGRAVSAADLAAVLARADACPSWPGLALMLWAGLRRGEALALSWADVDLRAAWLHVRSSAVRCGGRLMVGPPKSAAGVRDVPIDARLAPVLRAAFRRAPWGRVCPVSPETLARHWRQLQQAAGVAPPLYTLHDLRHTCATAWVLGGIPPKSAQIMLGHASSRLTFDLYTHIEAARIRADFAQYQAGLSFH